MYTLYTHGKSHVYTHRDIIFRFPRSCYVYSGSLISAKSSTTSTIVSRGCVFWRTMISLTSATTARRVAFARISRTSETQRPRAIRRDAFHDRAKSLRFRILCPLTDRIFFFYLLLSLSFPLCLLITSCFIVFVEIVTSSYSPGDGADVYKKRKVESINRVDPSSSRKTKERRERG